MTEKILAIIFVFIKSVIAVTGYGGIAILMAIESACIPLPSELIMPFGGYLVFEGTFKLLWVATAGAIGCNLGSLVAYEIGFYGGRPLVERFGHWILMSRRELDWADRFFARWGYLAVFIARLLPVIRTFIALPAGVARMPRGRFHIYTFLGSWPWCFGLAWLGMKLGENWRELGEYFHKFDAVIGIVLVVGFAWFIWSHWQNRMRRQNPIVSSVKPGHLMSGTSIRLTCCICGKAIKDSDSDGYSLQVRKFGGKDPGMIWAHGPCLRSVIPVVGVEIPSSAR